MSIFDKQISIYHGVKDTTGVVSTLRLFLLSEKHKEEIEYLRTLPTKEERNIIKKKLPQACISGIFSPTRKAENLKEHSGFICVDIDGQDNTHISNFGKLKDELCKLKEVAYISRSVSDNGYFLIIPLRYPDYHKQQFEQLKRDFLKLSIVIDKGCGDVSRMRCISHDDAPYINEMAIPYEGVYVEPKPFISRPAITDGEYTKQNVDKCCTIIEQSHIDITGNYDDWFTVGSALASLGETGRTYFHICSRQNEKYNYSECDRKFTQLLRSVRKISIGSFFLVCGTYGINYK